LAISIASAEDPYAEFEKEAADLGELHKIALTREVNKQFFLSRVSDKGTDGDISFDVLNPGAIGTHDIEGISDGDSVEKTASDNSEHVDKRSLVTDSMFVVKIASKQNTGTFKAKSYNNKLTMAFADATIEKNASDSRDLEERELHEIKARMIADLNDYRGSLIDTIADTARDASELRSIIKIAVDMSAEDVIGDIINASRETQNELMKVASVPLGSEDNREIRNMIEQAMYASGWVELIKTASSGDTINKEALGSIVKLVGAGVNLGLKGMTSAGKGAGKLAWAGGKKMFSSPAGFLVGTTALTAPAIMAARSDNNMKSAM